MRDTNRADTRQERVVTTGKKAVQRRDQQPTRLPSAPTVTAPSEKERVAEALDWLNDYEPMSINASTWKAIRPFVIEGATALVTDHGIYRQPLPRYVRALIKLACYCRETNQQLRIKTALDPYTVNQFAEATVKAEPANAGTYQSHLRFVGERLLPAAPWEKTKRVNSRAVPVPYSVADLAQLRGQIAKNIPLRRRGGEALMVLGLGAGLDGRWAAKVAKPHVRREGDGLLVDVDGRSVPVVAAFEADLERLWKDTPDDGLLVGGTATHKNAANEIARRLVLDAACPRLHCGRLRSTWIVHHLTIGTRLPELAAAAGTVGITTFSDLLEFVPPLHSDPEQAAAAARAMLRGQS